LYVLLRWTSGLHPIALRSTCSARCWQRLGGPGITSRTADI